MAQRSPEMVEALSAFINQSPFFAVLLFNMLEVVETDSVPNGPPNSLPTACTDSRRVYVNPSFFKGLTVPERVYVLAHEVSHVILQHPERMKMYMDMGYGPDLKTFSPKKFNHAGDYIINSWLNEMQIGRQPLGTLLNGQYGKDDLLDEVYTKLPDDPDGGDGWDQHVPVAEDAPGKAEIQRAVKMGANAEAATRGKLPAGLQRLVDQICDPQVAWQDQLRRTVTMLFRGEEASWARLNRRKLAVAPHIAYPGRIGNRCGAVGIEIDTSGSVGQEALAKVMGEIKGILRDCRPEMAYCMFVDAQLYNDEIIEIDDPEDLPMLMKKAGGGGGTDMTIGFRELKDRAIEVEYMIVLTDGYTPFGEESDEGSVPTIWCITTDVVAPWGQTVHIKV